MQVDNERLKSFALDAGLMNEHQIDAAIEESAKTGEKLGDVLVEQKLVSGDQLRQLFSYILGIPFVNIEKEIIPKDILQIVPEPIAKKYKVVAFKKKRDGAQGGDAQSGGYPDD